MKKILSLALAAIMVVSVLPVAYAADVDYTAGTAVEYTADADANRSYTITVPAELQPGQSGTVTLKGMWASNETVKVTADASVELTNSINAADNYTLDVEFAGIEKAGDNTVEKTYTETVKVDDMPAAALFGTWSGKFNYNVEFDDGAEPVAPTVMFKDVKYHNAAATGSNATDIMFASDGAMWYYGGSYSDEGSTMFTYTTKGQEVYAMDMLTGTFSADGYTYTANNGTAYIYTP